MATVLAETEAGRLLHAHLAARFSPDGRLSSVFADADAWPEGWRLLAPATGGDAAVGWLFAFCTVQAHSLSGAVAPETVERLRAELWSRATASLTTLPGAPPAATEDPVVSLYRIAVACAHDSASLEATIDDLVDTVAEPVMLERDLRQLVPSLRSRRLNGVARLLLGAIGLTDDTPKVHSTLLGMAALGTGRDAVLAAWADALDRADELARRSGSATVSAHVDCLRDRYSSVDASEGSLVVAVSRLPPMPLFERLEPAHHAGHDLSIEMARGFLLADPELREAWEVHRRGLFGRRLVSASFPAGLAFEVLADHGDDIADRIESHLDRLAEQAFTYYDAPEFPWVETDTLGSVLRLLRHVPNPAPRRAALEPLITRALEIAARRSEVPVWVIDDPAAVAAGGVVLLGEDCGAIQAQFLATLLAEDPDAFGCRLGPSIDAFLGRFIDRGLGIGVNYPPLYTAGRVRELLTHLDETDAVAKVRARLRAELATWANRALSVQEAALLIRACVGSSDEDLVGPRWASRIEDGQDFDGGWPAEPLFFAPNKGGLPTWYRSRTLTTAVCYDALIRFASRRAVAG